MNGFARNLALWIVIGLVVVTAYNLFNSSPQQNAAEIDYSTFVENAETGQVKSITVSGRVIDGLYRNGQRFTTYSLEDANLLPLLREHDVTVRAAPEESTVSPVIGLLLNWLPMLLFIGVWIFFMRQMQSGNGKAFGFGKSRARLLTENQQRVTFENVAGVDEAKEELQEIVEFLRSPHKFQRLGGSIPKGVLLVGPPGTGKTLLARAIAGEANVPFFTISGSDFVEMFVGVGASRVRDMFGQAKKNAPCIVFVDEIDAVGRRRGAGLGGGNDEREQTLNQLLVEMDGFEANEGVILIAATNRPDVLDPALLRPGRFDRQVVVSNPDIVGREKILRVHMRKVPVGNDVNVRTIARGTPGFSGADLANLVNEAALLAARRGRRSVGMSEFEQAKDKVMMGAERRSMVMTEDERKMTAYHESGHAIVMMNVEGHEPLHKVTIIPRGRALGLTMWLPERDKYAHTQIELEAQIAGLFGGRIAEELIYGKRHITTGAGNDIQQATSLARRMVMEFGFSDRLGPIRLQSNQEEVFLGHSIAEQRNMSDQTARMIDEEIRRIVEEGETKAREILEARVDQLHALAATLLEYETLNAEEVSAVLAGRPLHRDDDDETASEAGRRSSVPQSDQPQAPEEEEGAAQPENA